MSCRPANLVRGDESQQSIFFYSRKELNLIFRYMSEPDISQNATQLVNKLSFEEYPTTVKIPVNLDDIKRRTMHYSELSDDEKKQFEDTHKGGFVILMFEQHLNKQSNLFEWRFSGYDPSINY